MTDTARPATSIDYAAVVASPDLIELKHRQRRFAFPMAIAFLIWYFGFVLFAAFAPELMAIPVFGIINLGLLLGLGQFVTTFTITMVYVSYSNRVLDPLGAKLRAQLERQEAS